MRTFMHSRRRPRPFAPDPLAYFLTWTTYGSWLPGDARGWTDGLGCHRSPDPRQRSRARWLMTDEMVVLDPLQRSLVSRAIGAHCEVRGWLVHGINCRMQHVHVVVTATAVAPAIAMNQLKAWCSRSLNDADMFRGGRARWWTKGGSARLIRDVRGLENVVMYVVECQGKPR